MEKILEQYSVPDKEIPEPQMHLVILPPGIEQHDHQLQHPGSQGCSCRTYDAQRRKTQQTENQQCVQQHIQHQGYRINHRGNHHPLHAAHNIQIDNGDCHDGKGKGQHPQVPGPLRRYLRLIGKDPHAQLRHTDSRQGEYHGHAQGNPHGDAHNPFNGGGVSPAPVLGSEHSRPGGNAKKDQGHDKLHLSCQGGTGQCGFADLAQHDDIRRIHCHID